MKKLIMIAVAVALTACTGNVSDTDIKWAQETCEKRGGINYMHPEWTIDYAHVVCNDGSLIKRRRSYTP
jgi:hypothetical protein